MNNVSRGIRNNNPGNIRKGDPWQGLIAQPMQTDPAFCQFISPEYGIRAMIIILRGYQRRYGLHTIRHFIARWAPAVENDTRSYVCHVADALGVSPDSPVDTRDRQFMIALLQAIIRHENGCQPYGDEVFLRALELAGS